MADDHCLAKPRLIMSLSVFCLNDFNSISWFMKFWLILASKQRQTKALVLYFIVALKKYSASCARVTNVMFCVAAACFLLQWPGQPEKSRKTVFHNLRGISWLI